MTAIHTPPATLSLDPHDVLGNESTLHLHRLRDLCNWRISQLQSQLKNTNSDELLTEIGILRAKAERIERIVNSRHGLDGMTPIQP